MCRYVKGILSERCKKLNSTVKGITRCSSLLRPFSDHQPKIRFSAHPDCIQIGFRKSEQQKQHEIRLLQIRSKPHDKVIWNAIQIQFVQMRLQLGRSARSNRISECLLCHFTDTGCLNEVSWLTRRGARRPQILANVLPRVLKSAGHLSSSNAPRRT